MSKKVFKLKNKFSPAGDQPRAIAELIDGLKKGFRYQTLLGVTGSGKTFTVANVIAEIGKPTIVIAHNKTLAAQLAAEYREFFPENAVHYFVSYYDYYQPEAYLPVTDTYIEKEAQINEEIDRLRHAATEALLTRRDVIVVASVSCIYNLGAPFEYEKVNLRLGRGRKMSRGDLARALVGIHFKRTNADLSPGLFRAIGNNLEIMPVSERTVLRVEFADEKIARMEKIDPITRRIIREKRMVSLFPAKHFVSDEKQNTFAIESIKTELKERLRELEQLGKILEAERLKRRTNYDLAMIKEIGYCNGIENYSRHFSGRSPGAPPDTLLSYFPRGKDGRPDFLTIIDESHVTVPQLAGMQAGDASRKKTLIEHGFRLPSAADNRPLTLEEFEARVGEVVFTTATPSAYEREKSSRIVEQIIRPTGLVDPEVLIRPIKERGSFPGQVGDFIDEAKRVIKMGNRVIATTLTKKMAEDLAGFLKEEGIKAEYLHSEIETLDRVRILSEFRRGVFDCLVGVNLLREGLDLPEVAFIGILDADKEGFLRSETSLIQIIGRTARNAAGRVVLYADTVTGSIRRAMEETNRRRHLQLEYNKKHGITPKTIEKSVKDITDSIESLRKKTIADIIKLDLTCAGRHTLIAEKKKQMNEAVKELDFETAALLRDEIEALEAFGADEGGISRINRRKGRIK